MSEEKLKFVEKYKDYIVEPTSIGFKEMGGINYKFVFENGYGASVIRHYGTYGWEEGLFELAVLREETKNNYNLCYTTPITDDVLGWLTDEQVCENLEKIKKLESIK